MGEILRGSEIALKKREIMRTAIENLPDGERGPHIAVIVAGDDPASIYYANLIEKIGTKEGFKVELNHLKNPDTAQMKELVDRLNRDNKIDGVIIQLPLPPGLDKEAIFDRLSPEKDADGQTPENLGRLLAGRSAPVPATARAVVELLKGNNIDIIGREAVVIGRSTAVGIATALLLIKENATVTVCHTKTLGLRKHTSKADILIASAGVPNMLGVDDVKEGAYIVDVGTSEVDGEIIGDVRFDEVIEKASVSPVKGGVGALTLACLLENTFELYRKNIQRQRT
ncbi:MAG: bifunctional 5,10-methylenetetrahydrofolate dehydrogenase/5,10-methenyltetrahydrofolate cyclohydrolase [Elusimicrobia bacterium]|nr:bifunctional 5,10-methylenetetrahydrofolate dehydrogenase/5,10-methenyltetrahydrofolate cyclohydrolase [Elusimicrobiota bacterium]